MSRNPSFVAAEAIRGLVERNEWQMEEIKRGLEEADRDDFASDSK
jgi:predicted transcriptional regulator